MKNSPQDERTAAPPKEKRRAGLRGELDRLRAAGSLREGLRRFFRESPAFALSGMVHLLMVVALALVTLAPDRRAAVEPLVAATAGPSDEPAAEVVVETSIEAPQPLDEPQAFEPAASDAADAPLESTPFDEDPPPAAASPDAAVGVGLPANVGERIGPAVGKGYEGRGKAARAILIASQCGTPQGEQAVAYALKWLAAHQLASGGWSCDHGRSPLHVGPVNHPGGYVPECGSTGLALLVFLGAGHTHVEGDHRETVRRGLSFLGREMKADRNGGDLRGRGTLYDHGIATIALCEAYALTRDKTLAAPAQAALDFIHASQDKSGGGWRYTPGQAGDCSVVGWQVQALKSGHLAELRVDGAAVRGASAFLTSVQTEGGAYYGYTSPGKSAPLTAVGLLSRMYLGWKREEPALKKGVEHLAKLGPLPGDMYHNYYATQVLRHYGGDLWKQWNQVMRDRLVASQETLGDYQRDKGSWTPSGANHTAAQGGRLVETCFSAMTLEVYYRHLPLYQDAAGDSEF